MPEIKLNGPAVVNGAIRYPIEGLIPVTEKEAQRLHDGGFLDLDDEDDGLDDEKVNDLKALAELEGVDLGDASKKADIIAAIRAHRAANPEE
ncbi:hypothetical protein ACFOKF_16535 [Sphingobium rhizovicinum]|uniref:Rho termination factor N-terminal domain-containing protein n=1 Tax=Sphingobium rhizovicinum TaxID=432308 RepID=A0ABV7NJZ2_9SPHN